jgi:hypothetical protein
VAETASGDLDDDFVICWRERLQLVESERTSGGDEAISSGSRDGRQRDLLLSWVELGVDSGTVSRTARYVSATR